MKKANKNSEITEGINRYIMECKYEKVPTEGGSHLELIDTLWNVNLIMLLR